jgi:hypothetical protein
MPGSGPRSSILEVRLYVIFRAFCELNAHCLDKPLTEKLDYFSAGLSILFALYIAIIRLFHLYSPPILPLSDTKSQPPFSYLRLSLSALFCLLYLAHISYLSCSERFDYGYNILANVLVGIIHNILWIIFSIPYSPLTRYPTRAPPSQLPASKTSYVSSSSISWLPPPKKWIFEPALCVLLTTLAALLEIFDFPPYFRVIDAHSLWHLATALILPMWYRFLVQDSKEDGWVAHKL